MRQQRILVLLFLILILSNPVSGQGIWNLQKDKDGIKISSRKSSTSVFNDIRVELDLPGNTDQLAAILLDVTKYKEWSYATKKSVLIKQLGPGKLIYYTEIEVPWPATNRYFYANFELKQNPADHSVQVVASNLPDFEPATKDLVKVPLQRVFGILRRSQKFYSCRLYPRTKSGWFFTGLGIKFIFDQGSA